MAAAFRPLNSPVPTDCEMTDPDHNSSPLHPSPALPSVPAVSEAPVKLDVPSTPSAGLPASPVPSPSIVRSSDEATTPTRATFSSSPASSLPASQKPLPSSPFPQLVQIPDSADPASASRQPRRQNSLHSRKSGESEDVDMDESDPDPTAAGEEPAASDDESLNDAASRSGGTAKKKKSQRFYCTEFPPCSLSFTRSEHLARHIRSV